MSASYYFATVATLALCPPCVPLSILILSCHGSKNTLHSSTRPSAHKALIWFCKARCTIVQGVPKKVTFSFQLAAGATVHSRVSQKTQKSEFCFATKATGFHRLDEPPEKISAL